MSSKSGKNIRGSNCVTAAVCLAAIVLVVGCGIRVSSEDFAIFKLASPAEPDSHPKK